MSKDVQVQLRGGGASIGCDGREGADARRGGAAARAGSGLGISECV